MDNLHVTRTSVLRLKGSPVEVIELFEPLGEQKWAEGWQPRFVNPQSGVTEEGMVFTTPHQGQSVVWVMNVYDPARMHIEYVRFHVDSHVTRIVIRCSDAGDEIVLAEVSYTLTAFTEQGSKPVIDMTQEKYEQWMKSWESAINHYLREGCTLKHH